MPNEFATLTQHSAEYFGSSRDYWWNDDFLTLALRRWSITGGRNLLDVGCGVGHWGRAWARVLPWDVEVTGIDREAMWVEKAQERAARAGLGNRARYQVGIAEALPFPDNSYDFVTCQTLLIHVPNVEAVLSEMLRVTRPGGIVVAAEPNNVGMPVLDDALAAALSIEETCILVRFHMVCLRGKSVLKLGDESIGRVLPGLFSQMGLEEISICMNEKCCPLIPPYASTRAHAVVEEITDLAQRDFWVWSRMDTARYFAAGGGEERDFAPLWELARGLMRRVAESLAAQKYSSAGGALFFMIAGKKPKPGVSA